MRLVILETPYNSPTPEGVEANIRYARECMVDCLFRGEAPFASHLLYTQILDDRIPSARTQGIECGFAWAAKADAVVVYQDLGISPGMQLGIDRAQALGQKVEFRRIR
jgi:hypothetical protein